MTRWVMYLTSLTSNGHHNLSVPSTRLIPAIYLFAASFLEFLPLLTLFRNKYEPADLPYHLIVPSLPGFTRSLRDLLSTAIFVSFDVARIMNQVMLNLGFGSGYVAQGGDIGPRISRLLGTRYVACKGRLASLFAREVNSLYGCP